MRAIWVSISVILLDQFTKLAIQFSNLSDSLSFVMGELALVVLKTSPIEQQHLLGAMQESRAWMLLAGILIFHTMLARWGSLYHFITFRTSLGLQLASGGTFSYLIDYVLRGSIPSSIELQMGEAFTLKAGPADLALVTGFALLLYILISGKTRLRSKITLLNTPPAALGLSVVPRGVDNIHIDAHLSPEFCRTTSKIINYLVNLLIETQGKGNKLVIPPYLLGPFQKSFLQLHQLALRKAKGMGEAQVVDLFYLSLIKFIHDEVSNSVAARIQHGKEHTNTIANQQSAKASYQKIESLSRHKEKVVTQVNKTIVEELVSGQMVNLRKGVRGFLGRKRSFALDAITTPLIIANGSDNDDVLFEHYLLFGRGKHQSNSFMQFDRVLDETLREYLPLLNESDETDKETDSISRDFDSSNTTAEVLSRPSVLMHPSNITILFDQEWARKKLSKSNLLKRWRKHRKFRTHLKFQDRLTKLVFQRLEKAGLVRWICATYEVKAYLRQNRSDVSPRGLISLIVECETPKELLQRVDVLTRTLKAPPKNEEVVTLWKRVRQQPRTILQKHFISFMNDFSRYRRDLLLLYKFNKAASEIVLQTDEKTLQTSRSNYTLYDFMLPSEETSRQSDIKSHIIIKADLRGSTEVTDKLTQLALNPATHFERHFFTPINQLIEEHGAEKVFIEGDAIILSLYNHGDIHQDHLIAARACALAAGILNAIANQNEELQCYGLPRLELGIGIAYADHPPRFLFDGNHQITISPAINRADRLSACTWSIRNWRERIDAPASNVEVYQPSDRTLGRGEKAQKELVYNLNGILIEPEIFETLQDELSPKRIKNTLADMQESELFAIKVPDLDGSTRSLVIRKAPVKVYDPDHQLDECPIVDNSYFYEVIYNEEIINSLRHNASKLTQK